VRIRDLVDASADLEPADIGKTLAMKVRHRTNPVQDEAVALLLDDLTRQAFCHPDTGAEMICTLTRVAKSGFRRSQQVCSCRPWSAAAL
jgi:hypothetical protein